MISNCWWPTFSIQFMRPTSFKMVLMTIVWTESMTLLTRVVSVAVVLKWYLLRSEELSWSRNFWLRKSLKLERSDWDLHQISWCTAAHTTSAATAKLVKKNSGKPPKQTNIDYSLLKVSFLLGLLILLRAIILLVGESKWSRLDLLLEQINFVEENNERRVSEEHIVQHLSWNEILIFKNKTPLVTNNNDYNLLLAHQILSRSPAFCSWFHPQKVFDCSRSERLWT